MLDALKNYLESKGYQNIMIDALPAVNKQRDVIALFLWGHTVGEISDGTGVRYIQIRVRRASYDNAQKVCTELFKLLDSGTEEALLRLTPEVFCVARPRRGPLKIEAGAGYTTFYCEAALWGPN